MGGKPPHRTEMAQVMQVTDANQAGFTHGGAIMRLVDTAAGVAAMRHAGTRVGGDGGGGLALLPCSGVHR